MQGQIDNSAAQKLMLYWKKMKTYAKEKEMVDELVNALRDAGKANCADKVNEKFQLNEEIGPDDIPKWKLLKDLNKHKQNSDVARYDIGVLRIMNFMNYHRRICSLY